jgi:hypothetical protein
MGIKKRIVLGAIVGTTVFGSALGLAAGLDVSSGDLLGSGTAAVTSCDLNGVTATSYGFNASTGDVVSIEVSGISDNCDEAVVSVGASHSYTDSTNNSSNQAPMVSGSHTVRTFQNYPPSDDIDDNSIVVTLETAMDAEMFDVVTVTLHGGHPTSEWNY